MNFKLVISFLACMFVVHSGFSEINFYSGSYESAVALAKESKKMLFVDFRADWCKPCLEMEQTTFKDETLGEYVNTNYVALSADIDYSFYAMDLKEKYNVSSLPTILILDPSTGEVYLRIIGKKPAYILIDDLKSIESRLPYYEEPIANEVEPEHTFEKKKKCRLFGRKD